MCFTKRVQAERISGQVIPQPMSGPHEWTPAKHLGRDVLIGHGLEDRVPRLKNGQVRLPGAVEKEDVAKA